MRPAQVIAERFEIERLAGSGGMGAVYRALDKVEGGVVALKVLHGTGEEHADRFVREARALADLRHPGIVKYVAHGRTPQGELYLAMEWLEGEDLAKRLARAGLTVAESIQVVSRAAEALAVAHARGLVHRDVKPSNLFLPAGDLSRVKLLDFGVVRLQSASLAQTRTGMMLGTPGYMAPEQARGAKDIDPRADVFALGCVLFECLTGRPPFTGEHAMAVLAKIILDEAPRVTDLKKDVPAPLDALVARMLAKEPEERPDDAAAVASELAGLGAVGGSEQAPAAEHKAMLTIGEQRLVCAVLAGTAVSANEAEAATLTPDVDQAQRKPLQAIAEPFQARLEWLANGSIVATLSGQGSATDQAAQAARFSLALRGVLLDAPIALATGRAVVADRWPMGEVIDRAARLLSEAERAPATRPRPVAIDEVTAGLLDARFDVSAALPDPGMTYGAKLPVRRELHGERASAQEDAGRTLLGKATPFVGRDRELLTLEATFAECVGEPVARAVVVTGAPGVGKSRLRRELLARVAARDDADGLAVFTGRGDPMSAGSPFGLLAQVIRDAAGMTAGAPLADRQARLFARVSLHVPEAERARVTTFLGELCGTPAADDDVTVQLRAARQDSMLMGDQMRRAFEDWLAAECAAHPTALVLEDLHFGDLPTVKFIDAALRTAADKPLFVLALARPEVDDLFPRLWIERNAQEMRLGELSKKACEKLAQKVLGPGVAVDTLVERAGGNAFFLEELIRAAADGAGDALPATVLAVVQSRLEALPAEARRVLRAGSVYGMGFTRTGCTALLGGAERTGMIDEWLVDLTGREVLAPAAQGERYTFRHAPWREAAYAMLTEHDRTLGHRLAGGWLEQAGEIDPMVLAGHYERGGEPARAARWILRGAEQALEGNDLAAAVERAARGAAMQVGGAAAEEAGELHLIKAEAHRWRGESADAERSAMEAMRHLPRGSALWCAAAGEASLSSGRLGHVDELASLLTSLPPIMNDSPTLLAVAWGRVAQQLLYAGRRVLVDAAFRRLHQVVDDVTTRDPPSGARLQIALANQALFDGDIHAYLLGNEAAGRAYAQAGDLRSGCLVGVSVGFAYLELGAYGPAKSVLRDTLVSATRMGLPAVVTLAKHNLGLALARDGAIDAGRAAESEAVQGSATAGDKRMEGLSRHYLAIILLLGGDPGGAEREARAAVALLAANPPLRAHALATLGGVLLARAAPEAGATAREAFALLEQLGGLQEGEALVRLVHAEALAAAGDTAAAQTAIAIAQARLLERAGKIGDPAWRDSFLANVPEHARTLALHQSWQ